MCGRLVLHTPPAHLARFLDATLDLGLAAAATPSWNLPPTHLLYGVTHEPDGNRRMSAYRWGLVPRWAKSSTSTAHTINARSESVAEKPSYRGPFASQPCAIPVNGFYEWESRDGHAKQPYYFSRVDDELMILAGLYDLWYDPTLGPAAPALITCTIVTVSANSAGLYERTAPFPRAKAVRSSTIHGAAIIPNKETTLMNTAASVIILLASIQADCSPSTLRRFENVVTNAWDSAPSANKSRSRLGTRNAR